LELDYDGPRFYARAHFSTMDGKDRETGEYIGVLSPARAYLDAGVKIQKADLRVGSRLEAADDFTKVNDPSEERDSYALMDVYGVWQPDTGALSGLRLEAGVDNLTDANYERVFAGVSEPGRNFKVSVAYRATF
jgi:hemoglobin/transferrin/lactoferrin receptor protein